jgi:hypothetical protein
MVKVSKNRSVRKAVLKNARKSRMASVPGEKRGRNRLSDDGEVVPKRRKVWVGDGQGKFPMFSN